MLRKKELSLVKRVVQYSYGLLMATIAYLSLSWFQTVPGGNQQELQNGVPAGVIAMSSEYRQ